MEYEKIKQLIDDVGNSKLTELEIEFPDGTKIKVKKDAKTEKIIEKQETKQTNNEEEAVQETKKENGKIVKSPMVGTFYTKPSPTSEAYVQVGKEVKARRHPLHNRSNETYERNRIRIHRQNSRNIGRRR